MVEESFIGIILTLIVTALVLLFPMPIPDQYKLIAVSLTILLIVGIILYISNKKLKDIEEEQKRLNEKLKMHELLIEMRAEIKELQKRVFKK